MSLKNSLIVLWIYMLYVLGLWLFLSGYLLKRIVIHQNSTAANNIQFNLDCKDITSLHHISEKKNYTSSVSVSDSGAYLQRFDKAIIIIVDALRFDFAIYNASNSDSQEYFLNKMPVFHNLMRENKDKAALFRLIADPPTTTLQRLKGFTTGSLPTFIDVSLNFASSEITEDNILRQLKSKDKGIVFMGDDTWDGLFPKQFLRSYPYPSFNVKDLDTVDDGVMSHLFEEMARNDSDVIIAHFLGVDHCGHRYGPSHPEMARKLQQMNDVIQNVANKMKDGTLLLVLGDHGMTDSGDHGGDSSPETTTALFMYSPDGLVYGTSIHDVPTVSQVDIVPTLSLLLGVPIPFSNLGRVITPLFTPKQSETCFDAQTDAAIASAVAGMVNALQVQNYLQAYSEVSGELSNSILADAEKELHNLSLLWKNLTRDMTESRSIVENIFQGYSKYLKDINHMCSQKWANFNITFILIGAAVICVAVLFNIMFSEQFSYQQTFSMFCIVFYISGSLLSYSVFSFTSWCLLVFVIPVFIIFRDFATSYKWKIMIGVLCVTVLCVFVASTINLNSSNLFQFIVLMAMSFLSISLVRTIRSTSTQAIKDTLQASFFVNFVLFLTSFSNSFVVNEDRIVLFLLESLIIFRSFPMIWESTKSCFSHASTKSKSSKTKDKPKSESSSQWLALPLCVLCLISVRMGSGFYKCREEQTSCENSDLIVSLEKLYDNPSYKLTRLIVSLASEIFPVVIFLVTLGYKYSVKAQTTSTICVKYGIFFVCVFTSLRWWLNIISPNVVDRILKGNEVLLTRAALLMCSCMFLVILFTPVLAEKPWEISSKEIYGGSLVAVSVPLLQALHLIAGDALSPPITFMSFSAASYAGLILLSSHSSESLIWLDVQVWSLLTRHWFYGTSHQATFSSIQWDAAFLLHHREIHSYVLSGALVLINTFSSHIFHGVALPVLLVMRGSFSVTTKSVMRLHLKYLLCFGVKLLGTVFASVILRRHLMVWKIFSPKLLYESLGILTVMISACVGHVFMSRLSSQYHGLIRKNLNQMF